MKPLPLSQIQPRRGGSRLYCPVVDVPATEASGVLAMCAWPSRAQTAKGAKAIRRHVRMHVQAFQAETAAMMRWIQRGEFGGIPVRAEFTVSKPASGEPFCADGP